METLLYFDYTTLNIHGRSVIASHLKKFILYKNDKNQPKQTKNILCCMRKILTRLAWHKNMYTHHSAIFNYFHTLRTQ